jgi:hypothetical protein
MRVNCIGPLQMTAALSEKSPAATRSSQSLAHGLDRHRRAGGDMLSRPKRRSAWPWSARPQNWRHAGSQLASFIRAG